MATLKTWLKATRPRTVLLSFSGVLLGGFLASHSVIKSSSTTMGDLACVLFFAALTACFLQVLSNLANDFGDFKKGVDGAKRVGPKREMQSGAITEIEMIWGIGTVGVLCFLAGGILIFFAAKLSWNELATFGALGITAVLAALFYTLGKHPYGYCGWGDLFCFLFFGWASVAGTFYLATKTLDVSILLPASTMGFLSNAVLNINNMRDNESDRATGKNSLVVKIGLKKAYVYHILLIAMSFICLTVFLILKHAPTYAFLFWLTSPLFLRDLKLIKKTTPELLDPFLKRQVMHTFLLALAFGIPYLTTAI